MSLREAGPASRNPTCTAAGGSTLRNRGVKGHNTVISLLRGLSRRKACTRAAGQACGLLQAAEHCKEVSTLQAMPFNTLVQALMQPGEKRARASITLLMLSGPFSWVPPKQGGSNRSGLPHSLHGSCATCAAGLYPTAALLETLRLVRRMFMRALPPWCRDCPQLRLIESTQHPPLSQQQAASWPRSSGPAQAPLIGAAEVGPACCTVSACSRSCIGSALAPAGPAGASAARGAPAPAPEPTLL